VNVLGSLWPARRTVDNNPKRRQALFGEPDHDIGAVRRVFGDVPVAGFFAAGEIGPVAGKNFLHGFTASILLFREA
jgi:small ligand-binding sensory domain FIST